MMILDWKIKTDYKKIFREMGAEAKSQAKS